MRWGPLSVRQLFWLAFTMMFPTVILLLAGDLLRLGGRYAWYTPLVAGVPAAGLAWLAGWVLARRGELTRTLSRALGPLGSRLALAVVWAGVGAYAVIVVREFAQFSLVTYVFEDVPIPVLTLLGLIPGGILAWLGPTLIGRAAQVVAPVLILVYAGILLAALPFSHILWVLPLLPRSFDFATLQPLARTWVFLAEPALLTLLADHLGEQARRAAGRVLAAAVGLSATLAAIGLWVMVADFGPPRAAQLTLPVFNLAKEATYGSFLEHLEVFLIPIVIMGISVKLSIFFWLWTQSGSSLTRGGRAVWLLVQLVAAGAASIVLIPNTVVLDEALFTVLARFALPALLAAFVLAYGVDALRHGRSSS